MSKFKDMGIIMFILAASNLLYGANMNKQKTDITLNKNILAQANSPDVKISGDVERINDMLIAKNNKALIDIGQHDWKNYTAEFNLILSPAGRSYCKIQLINSNDCKIEINLKRDKTGASIAVNNKFFNKNGRKNYSSCYSHNFAPIDKKRTLKMQKRTAKSSSWHGKKLNFRIEQTAEFTRVWFEYRLVSEYRKSHCSSGGFKVILARGDSISDLQVYANNNSNPLFLPLPLNLYLNNKMSAKNLDEKITINKVPFLLNQTKAGNNLFMKDAKWVECKNDPGDYYGDYERGEWFAGDPARPFFRVPSDDYTAVWLLAVTDKNARFSDDISFRLGQVSFPIYGMSRLYDFQEKIPRSDTETGANVIKTVKTGSGNVFLIRVPLGLAISQDFDDFMTLDINKGLKLAVRQPDPCRFRIRPLGVPSGVHLFGITLERSPVKFNLKSHEAGNVFNTPQQPSFIATLENRLDKKQQIKLSAITQNADGEKKVFKTIVLLSPHEKKSQSITFSTFQHGFYNLEVVLANDDQHKFLTRKTTFALLPQDTRARSLRAPWGTWNFGGAHGSSKDIKKYGPLMRKLGIRFTLKSNDKDLAKYGLRHNQNVRIQAKGCAKSVGKYLKKYPNGVKRGLIFHEDAISGAHVMRYPDCLLGRSPYKFNENEQKRFDQMWQNALDAANEMRAKYPDFKLQFGNGNPQLIEEFLRRGFPKKYLDSIGNENCGFMRPPEAQPDNVGFSTLWTFKEIMKYYGYDDIPLDICYEWMCRGTSPGNLSVEEQRDYYMRDALLGLAWGLKFINPGIITDVSNGYYFSNWGSAGFCYGIPEMNPKPSYVGFAVLTQILDGATFKNYLKTNSSSLYCLHFVNRQKQNIYALWTLRGERKVSLKLDKDHAAKLTDWQDRKKTIIPQKGIANIVVSTTPIFFNSTAKIEKVIGEQSVYNSKAPQSKQLISNLENIANWNIEAGRNLELETHNFSAPRRKGNFAFSNVANYEGAGKCIRIKSNKPVFGKPIQPMYEVMAIKSPVVLNGKPKEIGLMVNGNSCWGRIIFELEDASGQRWVSIGASQNGTPTRWMADWLPKKELEKVKKTSVADWNTNDSEARSAINFDGWRYLSFPLPGQYKGEGYHWPRNCYWKTDKNGKVHYPLKFTKLIIELREKVVYIKDMINPSRADIYIKDLVVSE